MTRYEQGFMNKCAEYGLDVETSVELMKSASLGKEAYSGSLLPAIRNVGVPAARSRGGLSLMSGFGKKIRDVGLTGGARRFFKSPTAKKGLGLGTAATFGAGTLYGMSD